jgi:hypothetical protein
MTIVYAGSVRMPLRAFRLPTRLSYTRQEDINTRLNTFQQLRQ